MKKTILGLLAAVSMVATSAIAADKGPAMVFDLGGKFDKSFNQSAFNGAEKFTKDTGIKYRSFEIQNASQREQAYRRFARDGNSPVIAIGFAAAEALKKVAKEFPDTKFAIVDMVVDLPNVQAPVVFYYLLH